MVLNPASRFITTLGISLTLFNAFAPVASSRNNHLELRLPHSHAAQPVVLAGVLTDTLTDTLTDASIGVLANNAPHLLSDSEIQSRIQALPGWELKGNAIQSQRQFRDFVEAIAFVNRLVEPAEAAGHHPDLSISYNTVTITLTTHDVGGLTEQDFDLAAVISGIE